MEIIVNGDVREVSSGANIAAVLEQLGFSATGVATALNLEFVPAAARMRTVLSQGDRLEVLAPMQGG